MSELDPQVSVCKNLKEFMLPEKFQVTKYDMKDDIIYWKKFHLLKL